MAINVVNFTPVRLSELGLDLSTELCLPYKVDYDSSKGRYLRSTRDISVGETGMLAITSSYETH